MKKSTLLIFGLVLLFAAEIGRVYFIMPFPGSQRANTIGLAYFLDQKIFWIRLLGIILVAPGIWYFLQKGRWYQKTGLIIFLALYLVILYLFNFRFLADKMFYQPGTKNLAPVTQSEVDTNQLVIGAFIHGEAKAYPIQIIGYHHQVQDTLGGEPIMVTYCTVCRTGRIFSPLVAGKHEQFRLVGMDHFNAMFEDATTKSWWRQATGEAIAGPRKGTTLAEWPSSQMRLGAWIRLYPQTRIMQPDPAFVDEYNDLSGYDSGTIKGSLERRDSSSYHFKSWVVGVKSGNLAKAYDWNELVKEKMIEDTIGETPIVLLLEKDGSSFHVWNRRVSGQVLQLQWDSAGQSLQDTNTHSTWGMNGYCLDGPLKSASMAPMGAYQEFWHSWRQFHPQTSKF
jgi:Protein of unknown function (DUF3179)